MRSRDALRARVMPTPLERRPAEHHRVTPEPAVGPAFGSIMLCGTTTNKRKRNAARRINPSSAPYGRGSRSAERARLTAFHHGTCGSEPTPPLSSRTRFLGLGRGARSRWFERSRAVQRALPAPSCPSPATKSQTGCRPGGFPKAARERR